MAHRNNPVVVLNVAEKPSVARSLAGVFRSMDGARDGGMRRDANQVFTHENVRFPSVQHQTGDGRVSPGAPIAPHKMITTSVRGHLASQEFPLEFGWNKVDPVVLLERDSAPIETTYKNDMQQLERMLRNLARTATVLILWLDCDREGEAIGDEVRSVCLQSNPRLNVFRARFSTVLPQEIKGALAKLGRVNEWLVQAVQARSELDLRVGAAFTRFQTLRLQRNFHGFDSGVISYGPCQFPTLGFVVERWARIETFVPEDFWYIDLSIRFTAEQQQQQQDDNNSNTDRPIHFTWKRGRLYDPILCLCLYESCLDAGQAVVTSLQGRPKNKWRPVPLATVELQKRASRYLRIGSETLMAAAEELYQQGLISYPRTETERFSREFNHQSLIQQLSTLPQTMGAYASKLLTDNHFQFPRAGQHDDQAHPPITPCKAVDPNTIHDQKQRDIYILIVKHYLACCSRDAVGKETTLTVKMDTEEFTAKGLMILEHNWLEIYHPWERWSTGQGQLPPVQVGSRVTPTSLSMKEGRTAPPAPISEVELIGLMDRNGIGTDATIAQHITTIQERDYAQKDAQQRFSPTQLGIALVEGYNSMGYQLNKPDLRRETEHECNEIAQGRKQKDQVVQTILAKMKQCYQVATQEVAKLDEAVAKHYARLGTNQEATVVVNAHFSKCGDCGSIMALKQDRPNNNRGGGGGRNNNQQVRRKLLYCATCSKGWNLPRGQPTPKTQPNQQQPFACPICSFQVVQIGRGEGYEGNGYSVCPKCFSEPPAEHGGVPGGGDFRCFSCQHPSCTLATGTPGGDGGVEVFACPFCSSDRAPLRQNGTATAAGSKVCLRKNSRGFVLSCSKFAPGQVRCPYTIWLPKEAQTITIATGGAENAERVCPSCTAKMIHFVWKRGSVPPHMGQECTVCVLCDGNFRREMSVSLPQPGQVQLNRNRGAGGGRGGQQQQQRSVSPARRGGGGRGASGGSPSTQRRGGGGGGGGSGTCYKCGQPGHFSSNCPNNSGGGRGSNGCSGGGGGNGYACYKCGEPGHFANNCPNDNGGGGGGGGGGGACYKCGERGHFSNNCPSAAGGGGGNNCYKCGQPGHFASNCPNGGGGGRYQGSGGGRGGRGRGRGRGW